MSCRRVNSSRIWFLLFEPTPVIDFVAWMTLPKELKRAIEIKEARSTTRVVQGIVMFPFPALIHGISWNMAYAKETAPRNSKSASQT
jgi:hypothetical protein